MRHPGVFRARGGVPGAGTCKKHQNKEVESMVGTAAMPLAAEPSPVVARNEVPVRESSRGTILLWFAGFLAVSAVLLYLFARSDGWSASLGLSPSVTVVICVVFSLATGWLWLRVAFRYGASLPDAARVGGPIPPRAYELHGLGPVDADRGAAELYIDMVKRAVSNILYQDRPLAFYDHRQQPALAAGFSLARRVSGEDVPTEAQTLIGVRRLENIRACIEQVLADEVPGDLVEAGVFRGGATVFMRAVLKAHGVTDRRVFACDTFTPIAPKRPNWFILPLAQGLGAIPSKWWRRKIFFIIQDHFDEAKSFPYCTDPSEDLVEFVMWHLRNPAAILTAGGSSLEEVQSLFARYGLLDDQVVFLKGFFADTLPTAPLERASVIRLDGDTYESTRDAITQLHPKLSPGGFCIIDDYYAYKDCQRAVDEYRDEHGIDDEIVRVDNMAVCWRKS
jgi:hypothetical protein